MNAGGLAWLLAHTLAILATVLATEEREVGMNRFDIEKRADESDRMMLACSAPYVSFNYALKRGWITQAEYDEAERRSGRLWNYCGD